MVVEKCLHRNKYLQASIGNGCADFWFAGLLEEFCSSWQSAFRGMRGACWKTSRHVISVQEGESEAEGWICLNGWKQVNAGGPFHGLSRLKFLQIGASRASYIMSGLCCRSDFPSDIGFPDAVWNSFLLREDACRKYFCQSQCLLAFTLRTFHAWISGAETVENQSLRRGHRWGSWSGSNVLQLRWMFSKGRGALQESLAFRWNLPCLKNAAENGSIEYIAGNLNVDTHILV